jgi:hypothetical protein
MEFIIDHFDNRSPKGNDSCAVFVGMAHSGSPSLHAILEESSTKDHSASSNGVSSGFPIPRDCNMATPTFPITTMTLSEETTVLQTIPVIQQWTTIPQVDTELLPEWMHAYQEVRQCTLQVNIERGAV